jgi:GDP-mannose 4,6-dehydratase
MAMGLQETVYMGNLDSKRDWGHAKDYVRGMWLMLQQDKPEDFVMATGVTTAIREFKRMAFREVGVELAFKGTGTEEAGYVESSSNAKYAFNGYYGSNYATVFGEAVPVITVQTVPLISVLTMPLGTDFS